MATPSCESEGLSLQRYGSVFLSNRALPPWTWVAILADVTVGGTAWSHCVWACLLASCWPRMPPASLIAFWATCEPWSMAWPRLARVPVKHDSTPMVTGPLGCLPEVVEVLLPHAATNTTAATELATRRQVPARRSERPRIIKTPPGKPKPVPGEISPANPRCQWLDH